MFSVYTIVCTSCRAINSPFPAVSFICFICLKIACYSDLYPARVSPFSFPTFCIIFLTLLTQTSSSLSAIAQRRPSFYGRILPVLLSLDPASSIIKLRVPGAFHALKSAFSACLECTHSSAEPVFLLDSTCLDTFLLTGTLEMCPFALIELFQYVLNDQS
jgi:hypothetical protein